MTITMTINKFRLRWQRYYHVHAHIITRMLSFTCKHNYAHVWRWSDSCMWGVRYDHKGLTKVMLFIAERISVPFEGDGSKLEVASEKMERFSWVRGPLQPQILHEHIDACLLAWLPASLFTLPAYLPARCKLVGSNWSYCSNITPTDSEFNALLFDTPYDILLSCRMWFDMMVYTFLIFSFTAIIFSHPPPGHPTIKISNSPIFYSNNFYCSPKKCFGSL